MLGGQKIVSSFQGHSMFRVSVVGGEVGGVCIAGA